MTFGPFAGANSDNVFLTAVQWLQDLLLGPLATSLAVIAVAALGLMMLSGRINIRRGGGVILGCFILFGAANIAQGLREAAGSAQFAQPAPTIPVLEAAEESVLQNTLAAPAQTTTSVDPYAGAALRR